jgi:hypothetical protein
VDCLQDFVAKQIRSGMNPNDDELFHYVFCFTVILPIPKGEPLESFE